MHLVADQLMSSRKSEKEKRLCAVPFAVIPSRAGSQGIELDTQAPVDDRLPLLHALLANVARA